MVSTLVELREVTFGYGATERRRGAAFRLSPLSLAIERGEIVGVIGPNSAGKTTLIRLLTRVVPPSSGSITIDGRPLASLSAAALAREIAVVPQDLPQAFPFTVGELVLMGRYPHAPSRYFESERDRAVARTAMEATGVLDLAHLPLAELSGGERQRAVLARALAQEAPVLLLDEPTTALDVTVEAQILDLLQRLRKERGLSLLLVSHNLGIVDRVCDDLTVLYAGRVVAAGAPDEVLTEALVAEHYGASVRIVEGAVVPVRRR